MASLPPKPSASASSGMTSVAHNAPRPSGPIRFVERRSTKAPVLYVNHIPQDMSDALLIKILDCCGNLVAWRRVRDKTTSAPPPSNTTPTVPVTTVTMKPWGFVEYETWDGALTALRVLGGQGGDQKALGRDDNVGLEWIAPNGKRFRMTFKADNKVAAMLEEDNGEKKTPEHVEHDKKVLEGIMQFILAENPETGPMYKEKQHHQEPEPETAEAGPTTELLKRELARFRDKTAFQDKKGKRGMEEDQKKLQHEEIRLRERDRMSALLAMPDPGNSLFKDDGPWSETDDDEDEDRIARKAERKKQDAIKDYEDRVRWWENREVQRISRHRDMESRQQVEEARSREDEDRLLRSMADFDDDYEAQARRHDYYRDPRRYWSRRLRIRDREQQADEDTIRAAQEAGDIDAKDEREEQEVWSRLDQKLVDKHGTAKFDRTKRRYDGDYFIQTKRPRLEDSARIMTAEERERGLKELKQSLPNDDDELLAWPVQWRFLDESMLSNKMKPFIAKRVSDYLGEEDPDMIEFVLDMLKQHPSAKQLQEELRGAVEDEADDLVKALWKTLVFETESRSRGLA